MFSALIASPDPKSPVIDRVRISGPITDFIQHLLQVIGL